MAPNKEHLASSAEQSQIYETDKMEKTESTPSLSNSSEPSNATSTSKQIISVKYCGETYDVTEFMLEHPGGVESIMKYKDSDISAAFLRVHGNSESAKAIFSKLKLKESNNSLTNQIKQSPEDLMYPKLDLVTRKLTFNDFSIDLSKGYINQIKPLSEAQYTELISNPVNIDFYVPLFDYKPIDALSNSQWYHVLIAWTCLISWIFYTGLTGEYSGKDASPLDQYVQLKSIQFSLGVIVILIIIGFCFWSLMEYALHRFLFHMERYIPDHYLCRQLSFIIHGIHHAMPMDAGRLVFPPALGFIFYYALSTMIYTVILNGNAGRILVAGFAFGYLHYDMIHYSLHHFQKQMKQLYGKERINHFKHHYVDDSKGFGISTKFWDNFFQTQSL